MTILQALEIITTDSHEQWQDARDTIDAAVAIIKASGAVDVKLTGLKRGGKERKPTFCGRCGHKCESAKAARDHCRGTK